MIFASGGASDSEMDSAARDGEAASLGLAAVLLLLGLRHAGLAEHSAWALASAVILAGVGAWGVRRSPGNSENQ
jgi:hypothetical protein